MAALVGAMAAASVVSSFLDKPYRSALTLVTGVGVYMSMKGTTLKEDIKSIQERLNMMSEQFQRSLVIAFSTPVVLASLSWRAICHAVTSFITSIGLIPLSAYAIVSGALAVIGQQLRSVSEDLVNTISSQQPLMIGHSPEDSPDKSLGSLAAVLFTCIASAFSISASMPSSMRGWIAAAAGTIMWTGTKYQALSTFFAAFFSVLRGMVDWCIGKLSRADISSRISTNRPDIIDAWLAEVDTLTDPVNENDIYCSPIWLKRVLECAELGDLIFRDVMKERPLRFPIPGLIKRYGDMKRLRDRAVSWSSAASIRQEPICVWLEGISGVGKSQVSNYVGYAIAEAVCAEVKGNPIYDIQPGTKFWTGCQGRVIARFDDFSILRGERNTDDLSNFMRLKSPAIFISEQAEIEDKGKPWSPKGIVVNSNLAFPCMNEVVTHEAFYRRRDLMYCVTYMEEFQKKFPALCASPFDDPRVQEAFESMEVDRTKKFYHLEFKRYLNPANPSSSVTRRMKYDEFIEDVKSHAKTYSDRQEELYIQALDTIANLTSIKEVDMPLSAHLTNIKGNVETVMCKLVEPSDAADFKAWIGSFGVIGGLTSMVPDLSSVTENLPNLKKMFVGESDDKCEIPEEPPQTPVRAFISRILRSQRTIDNDGPHGPSCLCDVEYTKALRSSCLHCTRANVFSKDSNGWDYDSGSMMFYHGSAAIPLICGVRCVFSIHGVKTCLEKSNSWVTKTSAINLLDAPQLEEPTPNSSALLLWMKETVGTLLSAIYGCLSSVVFYIISFLIIGGYFAYKYYTRPPKVAPAPMAFKAISTERGHIVSSGDPKSSKFQRAQKVGVRLKSFKQETRTGHSPNDLYDLIRHNIVWLQFVNGDNHLGSPMRCYGLSGYFALTLKHYWRSPHRKLATHVRVMRCMKSGAVTDVTCPVSSIEFLSSDSDTEYMVVRLPPQVTTAFRDIRHHFGNVSSFEANYYPRTCQIMCQGVATTDVFSHDVSYEFTSSPVVGPDGVQSSVVTRPMRYRWGGPGKCMSVVLGYISGKQVIMGFHVAGSSDASLGIGMAEPLFVENLVELKPQFEGREEVPQELVGEVDPSICIDSSVMPICTLVKRYAQARDTKIVPSALQPLLRDPPTTRPAPLTRNQVPEKNFDPMEESIKPHGQPAQACHPDLYKKSHEDYTEMILNNCPPVASRVRVLTQNEAIEGIPEIGLKSLELSTSEGFPFVLYRTSTAEQNKRWLIKREVENGQNVCKEVAEVLAATLTRKANLRDQGVIPCTVFSDCLKDARIPIFKLGKPGSTRIISVSPVDYTIHFRQYFGAFLCAFRHNRLQLEHAIGINVQGLEWTVLAGKLHGPSPGFSKFIDGDHSKFGPRLDPIDSMDFVDTINQWYRLHDGGNPNLERECKIRTIMVQEAVQAYHLAGNLVYQVLCGMPSGFPGTTEWNCASNSKWIRRAWLDCWKEDPSMCNFVAYRKHVRLYTYGDDLVMGVSDDAVVKFNGRFLRDFFSRHDMKFTDAQKGDDIDLYKDFKSVSFLKHKWASHPQSPIHYLAQIDEQSIHECYRWIHDDGLIQTEEDKILPTLQNCEMALYLAYGHGPEFYENLRSVFVKWYRQCKADNPLLSDPRFYSWEELDAIVWPVDDDERLEVGLEDLKRRYASYLSDAVILNLEP